MKFLNRRIPFVPPANKDIRMDILIGAIVFFILVVFQPFGINKTIISHLELKLLGFGILAMFMSYLFQTAVPRQFPKYFNEESWTIGRGIATVSFFFLIIGLCNGLYAKVIFHNDPSFNPSILSCILYTYATGLIPLLMIISWDYITFLEAEAGVTYLDVDLNKSERHEAIIEIEGLANKDALLVPRSQIILCTAMGNYLSLHYLNDAGIQKHTFRKKISALAKELPADQFIRCHRSNLVNMDFVIKEEGNTRGLKLTLKHVKQKVQVSRPYVPAVREWFSKKAS